MHLTDTTSRVEPDCCFLFRIFNPWLHREINSRKLSAAGFNPSIIDLFSGVQPGCGAIVACAPAQNIRRQSQRNQVNNPEKFTYSVLSMG
jgi:TctA family transporter